jgi:hypothetical protein
MALLDGPIHWAVAEHPSGNQVREPESLRMGIVQESRAALNELGCESARPQ